MNKMEIARLFERIKKHYNTFGYDDAKIEEWHRFLQYYNNEDILNSFDKFLAIGYDRPPYLVELTKNLNKIETTNASKRLQCEFCKEWVEYNTMDEFDRHWRRCDKIDFINKQRLEIEGIEIDYEKYRKMSNEELDRRYRKIMDNWKETHPDIAISPGDANKINNIFKKMENEEDGERE